MQKLREGLTLLLLCLLPFHALIVTVLTRVLAGPNHAPLSVVVVWKETLLVLILLLTIIELCGLFFKKKLSLRFDAIDACILALTLIAVLLGARSHMLTSGAFVYGARYDLFLPLSFLLLRRVPWSAHFTKLSSKLLITLGVVLSVYGLITLLIPESFFVWLGYANSFSLYFPNAPLTDFQKIAGLNMLRAQSTFSGPNQFGIWLLLPIAYALYEQSLSRMQRRLIIALLLAALFFSFCRSAWVALIVMAAVMFFANKKTISWKKLMSPAFLGALVAVVLCCAIALIALPDVFVRLGSTRAHFSRPVEAVQRMIEHPLGEGLGSAGPATNHISDSCVFLRPGDEPGWAKQFPQLCVYVGDKKVQPLDRDCHCPFLPENWYLQIGVELGVLGFVIYLAMFFLIFKNVWKVSGARPLFLGVLGVCISGLFLHSFEDFGVAATSWVLLSSVLHSKK